MIFLWGGRHIQCVGDFEMKNNSLLKSGYFRIHDDVKLRREYFGGVAFHSKTGTMLEVDDEMYNFLYWLRQLGEINTNTITKTKRIHDLLPILLSLEIIIFCTLSSNIPVTKQQIVTTQDSHMQDFILSAPETVHLAVTYRCLESCLDCYAHKYSSNGELNTADICSVITNIAEHGVFQLAIGGGEPFIRPDLGEIVYHATKQGLVVHVTTGQYTIGYHHSEVLKYAKSLHVGIRSELLILDTNKTLDKLRMLVKCATESDTLIGANIIITQFTIQHLHQLVELLVSCGFQRIIFLRYKPTHNATRWQNENPNKETLQIFEEGLFHIKRTYPQLMVRLDCAAAFLMKGLDEDIALQSGIKGCVAGDRILSVSPDGSVYPCSQLVGADFCAGNIAHNSFEKIWRYSDVLNRYRKYRHSASFINSVCGKCVAKDFCGGCRIFANDSLGGESICPIE